MKIKAAARLKLSMCWISDANYQACRLGDVLYWSEGKGGDWYYRCVMSGDTPEKQWLEKLNEPLLSHNGSAMFKSVPHGYD